MTEQLPEEVQFAEISNNQQNLWRLLDAHNQLVRWVREMAETEEEVDLLEDIRVKGVSFVKPALECTHENSYQMRPGIMRCKDCKAIYKV